MSNCKTLIYFNGFENTAYLMARRDIEEGEELTFDYNYEKTFDWLD